MAYCDLVWKDGRRYSSTFSYTSLYFIYIHLCSAFEVYDSILFEWFFITIICVANRYNMSQLIGHGWTQGIGNCVLPFSAASQRLHGSLLQGKNLRASDTKSVRISGFKAPLNSRLIVLIYSDARCSATPLSWSAACPSQVARVARLVTLHRIHVQGFLAESKKLRCRGTCARNRELKRWRFPQIDVKKSQISWKSSLTWVWKE